ncbi:MAG: hypothetical protein IPG71_10665 [bacterium]|nr:hypothetical protein [bacterium]
MADNFAPDADSVYTSELEQVFGNWSGSPLRSYEHQQSASNLLGYFNTLRSWADRALLRFEWLWVPYEGGEEYVECEVWTLASTGDGCQVIKDCTCV